jgi:hypothetical protein
MYAFAANARYAVDAENDCDLECVHAASQTNWGYVFFVLVKFASMIFVVLHIINYLEHECSIEWVRDLFSVIGPIVGYLAFPICGLIAL